MALIITSETVTETDLSGISETIRTYTAVLNGKKLSDIWIVPVIANDMTERAAFTAHLQAVGYNI